MSTLNCQDCRNMSERVVELAKALCRAIDHIADSCSDHPIVDELNNVLLGKAPDDMSGATCVNCRGPLPIDFAATIHPDGSRSCLGACRPLYLFESGNPDWVVASDEDEARALWCAHLGESVENYANEEWTRLADDAKAKYWLDPVTGKITDDGGVLTELTALEAVNRFGRGFVASVDF